MRTNKNSFSLLLRSSLVAASMAWAGMGLVQAEDLRDCLVVHMLDGKSVSYVLEDQPKVTFVEDKLHIEANAVSDDLVLADVAKFTFEKLSGVEEITAGNFRITVNNDLVRLEGGTPGAIVNIVDLQGRLNISTSLDEQGSVTILLADLSTGVYVVSTSDGVNFKLLR